MRPASCVPSPQRREGQDEGGRTVELNSGSSEPPHPNPLLSGERESQASPSRASARALTPNHTNPAACIAALCAPARRYCAAWPRGCPAAPATAPDAACDRARGAGSRPRLRSSGAAGARLARAGPPQGERVAIAALLQRLLDREALRVLDRLKLRLGFHARFEHGGQHGEVLAVLLLGLCHGQTLPSRGAFLRPRFLVRTIANGSRACKSVVTSSAKPVRSRERQGWCLPFGLPLGLARSKLQEINEGSGVGAVTG